MFIGDEGSEEISESESLTDDLTAAALEAAAAAPAVGFTLDQALAAETERQDAEKNKLATSISANAFSRKARSDPYSARPAGDTESKHEGSVASSNGGGMYGAARGNTH